MLGAGSVLCPAGQPLGIARLRSCAGCSEAFFKTSVINLRCSLGSTRGHGATLSCHACTIFRTACDKLNFKLLSYLKGVFSFSCLLSWFVRSGVAPASVTHLPSCEPIVFVIGWQVLPLAPSLDLGDFLPGPSAFWSRTSRMGALPECLDLMVSSSLPRSSRPL